MRYRLKHIDKTVSEDHYETGCETKHYGIPLDVCACDAPSLAECLQKIGERYGVKIDYAFFDASNQSFSFNRQENADGEELSAAEFELFKVGKCRAWLADYWVQLEKYETIPITEEEFSGIEGLTVEHA